MQRAVLLCVDQVSRSTASAYSVRTWLGHTRWAGMQSWTLAWRCVVLVCLCPFQRTGRKENEKKNGKKCFAHSHIPLKEFLDIKAGVMTVKVVSFYSRKGCHAHTFRAGVYLCLSVFTCRHCQEILFSFVVVFVILHQRKNECTSTGCREAFQNTWIKIKNYKLFEIMPAVFFFCFFCCWIF